MSQSLEPLLPDLNIVLETALDAVILMREDGTVAGWNRVAERIFGWSEAEAMGKRLSSLIIPERYRQAHSEGLAKYLATGQASVLNRLIEISALRSSGEEFPVELSITPAIGSGQKLFLGFLRDISDRREAELIMNRSAAEAKALSHLTALAAESSSFDDVMGACLAAVCEITGWSIGHAFRCSNDKPPRLIDAGVWHSVIDRDLTPLQEITARMEFASGVGLPGRVLAKRGPIWIARVREDPNFPRILVARSMGLYAAFGFPILSERRVIAVLEFFHTEPEPPDPSLLPAVQTLGSQVGRVFERTRAAEKLREERETLVREVRRREELEKRQRLLLAELNHRVKNMLSVVMAVATQTAKTSPSVDEFNNSFAGRLVSLAKAHSLLAAESWEAAPLDALVQDLIGDDERVAIQGPPILLPPRAMLALSLILHELATNAMKYGALSVPEGRVRVEWEPSSIDGKQAVLLRWRETGLTGVVEPSRAGFGTKLITTSVRRELGGSATPTWRDEGLDLRLEFRVIEE
jgi:PAS domain S-box-containing protein